MQYSLEIGGFFLEVLSNSQFYPVFYLLHGMVDDETGRQQKGSANFENLYADGKLVPTIVVMPNGDATAETGDGGFWRGGHRGGFGAG